MAETKKFLDQSGVSILWSRISEELEKKQTTLDAHAEQIDTINDKIEALEKGTYDDSELRDLISTNTQDIATLKGAGEGSVSATVAAQIAEVVAGADASFDTLKEIADWILNDETGAADMANDIQALQKQLEGVDSTVVETVTAMVESALTEEGVNKYALAEDLTNLTTRVATLENAGYQTSSQVNSLIDTKLANLDSIEGLSETEIDEAIASAAV